MSAEFNLLPHGDPIGAIFQTQQCQDNDVIEFARVIAAIHYLCNIEQTIAGQGTARSHLRAVSSNSQL